MKLNHCFRNFFLFLIHDLYTCLIASKLDTNHSFVGSGRLGKIKSHFWYSGWLKIPICKHPRIMDICRKILRQTVHIFFPKYFYLIQLFDVLMDILQYCLLPCLLWGTIQFPFVFAKVFLRTISLMEYYPLV